jgi:hypothetical protein
MVLAVRRRSSVLHKNVAVDTMKTADLDGVIIIVDSPTKDTRISISAVVSRKDEVRNPVDDPHPPGLELPVRIVILDDAQGIYSDMSESQSVSDADGILKCPWRACPRYTLLLIAFQGVRKCLEYSPFA